MSNTINLTISGNLTAKPTQKTVKVGDEEKKITEFTLASNDRNDAAQFFKVEVWGERGNALLEHLDKGKKVIVTSNRIKPNAWYSNTAQAIVSNIVVTANSVEFC